MNVRLKGLSTPPLPFFVIKQKHKISPGAGKVNSSRAPGFVFKGSNILNFSMGS